MQISMPPVMPPATMPFRPVFPAPGVAAAQPDCSSHGRPVKGLTAGGCFGCIAVLMCGRVRCVTRRDELEQLVEKYGNCDDVNLMRYVVRTYTYEAFVERTHTHILNQYDLITLQFNKQFKLSLTRSGVYFHRQFGSSTRNQTFQWPHICVPHCDPRI